MIRVEYDPQEVDRFITLADAIEAAFPSVVVEGNEEEDGRPGSFEVSTPDGRVLFSRLGCGLWPEAADIVVRIRAAGAAAVPGTHDAPGCS